MTDLPGTPDEVSLGRLFPWLRLVRAVGMALDPKKLALAAVALILLPIGWQGLDRLFGVDAPGAQAVAIAADVPRLMGPGGVEPNVALRWFEGTWPVSEPIRLMVLPFFRVFSTGQSSAGFAHGMLAAAWGVVIAGLIGGAIARIAVVQAARGERVGMRAAVRFARAHWFPLVGTPLGPLVGIGFFAILVAGFGLLYWIPGVGPALAGILFFLPMLAGLMMAILLSGLAAGWPLMAAAVAAESEDAFDALSRSYAYVNQRPAAYLAYAGLAWLIGVVGWAFVALLAALVVHLTRWALGVTVPARLLDPALQGGAHAFWLSLVPLVAHAWLYAYFWSAAALIYLLLRRDVDGTPWHEVAGSGEAEPSFETPETPPEPEPVAPAPEVAS